MIYIFGCSQSVVREVARSSTQAPKGYVLYVFTSGTQVLIDLNRHDGISNGTMLDILRMNVPGMDEPVKIAEVRVKKVGDKMSTAEVTAFTSSLKIERGDRVLPKPVIIVSDASWKSHLNQEEGWNSEFTLPNERNWSNCYVVNQIVRTPAAAILMEEVGAKPIWNPSVKSRMRNAYFRRAFQVGGRIVSAWVDVVCEDKVNLYINGNWVSELRAKREQEGMLTFNVTDLVKQGRNVIAVEVLRDENSKPSPFLLIALTVHFDFIHE